MPVVQVHDGVAYPDTHCPFSHVLEGANLPDVEKITSALRRLAEY